tara:strand:- start:709 stop:933 length:225 start_codon:yes stop_codon:yes gene_type:complete
MEEVGVAVAVGMEKVENLDVGEEETELLPGSKVVEKERDSEMVDVEDPLPAVLDLEVKAEAIQVVAIPQVHNNT